MMVSFSEPLCVLPTSSVENDAKHYRVIIYCRNDTRIVVLTSRHGVVDHSRHVSHRRQQSFTWFSKKL